MSDPTNWRELIDAILPSWLSEALSSGFVGVDIELVADTMEEGMSEAIKMPWLLEPTSPPDALPLIGSERRMPRYPAESQAQYRARLWGAWDAYQFGGDESAILGQLAAAGFPGAQIYDPGNFSFLPAPYWSHFVLYFPVGTHPVTAEALLYGSFNWGGSSFYGPVGITPDQLATIRGIIAKWKPVEWICRQIIFQISGFAYGTGHTYGEASLNWGGAVAITGA